MSVARKHPALSLWTAGFLVSEAAVLLARFSPL